MSYSVSNVKILIAEREAVVADVIAKNLKNLGYVVTGMVDSGELAIQQAIATAPDIVLMDIGLKGPVDGIAAAWRISNQLHCPVIYTVGYTDDEVIQRAKLTNPYGFLSKPFTLDDLKQAIATALRQHRFYTARQEAAAAAEAIADEQFMQLLRVTSRVHPMPRVCFENGNLKIYASSWRIAGRLYQRYSKLQLQIPYEILAWAEKLQQYRTYKRRV